MKLNIPSEPSDVKEQILALRARSGSSDIDWDSLAVWFGNRVQSYLWRYWKIELRREGFTWQRFLKLMKYRTDDIVLWVSGNIPWVVFVNRVIKTIQGPLGEAVKNRF